MPYTVIHTSTIYSNTNTVYCDTNPARVTVAFFCQNYCSSAQRCRQEVLYLQTPPADSHLPLNCYPCSVCNLNVTE